MLELSDGVIPASEDRIKVTELYSRSKWNSICFGNIERELFPVYHNVLCGPIDRAAAKRDITQCGFNCNSMGGTNPNGHSQEDVWNSDGTVDASVVNQIFLVLLVVSESELKWF